MLEWQLLAAREAGIDDIVVVTGYRSEAVTYPNVRYIENPLFDITNMVETLWCAEALFSDDFIVSYGDILYEPGVLERLIDAKAHISVVVDKGWQSYWEQRFPDILEDAETLKVDNHGFIQEIGQKPQSVNDIQGQYIGLTLFRDMGVSSLRVVYGSAVTADKAGENPFGCPRTLPQLYMTDILQAIIETGMPVREVPIERGWLEVDTPTDVELATELIQIDGDGFTIKVNP